MVGTGTQIGRALLTLLVCAGALASTAHPASAADGKVELVSAASGSGGADANGDATDPAISSNGRFVAFASTATNLDPAVTQPIRQIYVRDLATKETTLVSRSTGVDGAAANLTSSRPSISSDGRYVVFDSEATNLASSVSGRTVQVYVRDLVNATTTLVSKSPATGLPADRGALVASISADGQLVAFISSSTNLVVGLDSGDPEQAFVADIGSGTIEVGSRDRFGSPVPSGIPDGPVISGNGEVLAFGSFYRIDSRNPGSQGFSDFPGLFTRNLSTGKVSLASRSNDRKAEDAEAEFEESISHNGSQIPFTTLDRVSATGGRDRDGSIDAFIRDEERGKTILLSRGFGEDKAEGERDATRAVIAPKGKVGSFIASRPFDKKAKNAAGLFVRDVREKKAVQVPGTRRSPVRSLDSSLSANGRIVAFSSSNPRLGEQDGPDATDVFMLKLSR